MEIVQRTRQERIAQLPEAERLWRDYPGDGRSPLTVSSYVMEREVELLAAAQARLLERSETCDPAAMVREAAGAKYFPVLLISAPHIEDPVSGTFPGTPTPLLFATAILDRALRIDEFQAPRVPHVSAVMNPPLFSAELCREIEQRVADERPVVVAISNLSESHHFALRIARLVKAVAPETIVVLGGQHEDATNPDAYLALGSTASGVEPVSARGIARARPLQTLASGEDRAVIDFVAAGDGPHLFNELMRVVAESLETGADVKSRLLLDPERFARLLGSGALFFVVDDVLQKLPLSGTPVDGNELPFISLQHLTHENRFPVFGGKLTAQVMACVGCKYACAFCHESADHAMYGLPKLLQRRVEHVVLELRLRAGEGHEAVFFDDSTFTQDRRWTGRFLDELDALAEEDITFEWGCQTTINDLSPELLQRMAASGCSYIYFGFESARPGLGSVQKMRRVVRSGVAWSDRFEQVARWCSAAGIRVGTSLQFGLGETPEDRLATFGLLRALFEEGVIAPGCVALNVNAPYPGTTQWVALLEGRSSLPDYREYLRRHPAFETAHQFTAVPADELDDLYEQARDELGEAILSVDFASLDRWRSASS